MNSNRETMATYVFTRCALAMLMLWLSFPPIGLFWLAWLALLPLISVIVEKRKLTKGHYWAVWFVGLLYWLGTFYFIPIPHPLLWIGWIVISLYLACYLPFTVLSARTLIFRFHVPALVSIPVVWTGWELVRCYLFTGMPLVCLSHTQYQLPTIIQVADLSGAYTLTFCITLFSTALYATFIRENRLTRPALVPLVILLAVAGAVVGYGSQQISQDNRTDEQPLIAVLVQGSIDTVFPDTIEEAEALMRFKTQQYIDLTHDASTQWDDIQLVIWPENGWPFPDLEPNTDKSKMTLEEIRRYDEAISYIWPSLFRAGASMPHFLVGAESYDPVKKVRFASALNISNEAKVVDRYYKKHLVMFGEYVPLSKWIPLLQKFPAIGTGLQAGEAPVAMKIEDKRLAPNICFESTVPHFIRNQVNQLASAGNEPDVLVNITNDGWFYGTSCLDFHLACNVFRAVEMRKPHLVCANTGLSAAINEKGEIEQQGPRRATEVLRVEVVPVNKSSLYRSIGDTFPIGFAVVTVFSWLLGMFVGSTKQQQSNDSSRVAADPPTGSGD